MWANSLLALHLFSDSFPDQKRNEKTPDAREKTSKNKQISLWFNKITIFKVGNEKLEVIEIIEQWNFVSDGDEAVSKSDS